MMTAESASAPDYGHASEGAHTADCQCAPDREHAPERNQGSAREHASTASLAEQCAAALRRLAAIARPPETEWLDVDLTMGQLKAVFALTCKGPTPVGGLARLLGIAEPSASLLVDRLEERGLVRRSADQLDRRRTLVEPTEKGRAVVRRLQRVRDERLAEWLGRLSENDLRALLRGLNALVGAIEASASAEFHEPGGAADSANEATQ